MYLSHLLGATVKEKLRDAPLLFAGKESQIISENRPVAVGRAGGAATRSAPRNAAAATKGEERFANSGCIEGASSVQAQRSSVKDATVLPNRDTMPGGEGSPINLLDHRTSTTSGECANSDEDERTTGTASSTMTTVLAGDGLRRRKVIHAAKETFDKGKFLQFSPVCGRAIFNGRQSFLSFVVSVFVFVSPRRTGVTRSTISPYARSCERVRFMGTVGTHSQ